MSLVLPTQDSTDFQKLPVKSETQHWSRGHQDSSACVGPPRGMVSRTKHLSEVPWQQAPHWCCNQWLSRFCMYTFLRWYTCLLGDDCTVFVQTFFFFSSEQIQTSGLHLHCNVLPATTKTILHWVQVSSWQQPLWGSRRAAPKHPPHTLAFPSDAEHLESYYFCLLLQRCHLCRNPNLLAFANALAYANMFILQDLEICTSQTSPRYK